MAVHRNTQVGSPRLSTLSTGRIFARTGLAGAVALTLGGAYLAAPAAALPTSPEAQTAAATGFAGPPSFAEVAAQVTPAVVNVTVTRAEDAETAHPRIGIPGGPEAVPLPEFFQRFFDDRYLDPKGHAVPREAKGEGSGFIIDAEGHIVTNNHVIADAAQVQVMLNDGTTYQADIKGRDAKTDIALLKIEAEQPLPHVELGDSDSTRVGDWVLAVGNPFGLGGSVSAGIVSARGRDINSGPYHDYLQIDAPINRGNSGGPLFDAQGRVVGVNTAIYSPSGGNVGIGFAIPSSSARAVIAQLKERGHVERGWLGVEIQAVTEEVAASLGMKSPRGVLIADLVPNGPAAKAGLRAGDLILSVGGTAIDELKALPRLIADTKAGTELVIELLREGAPTQIRVGIGPMPGQEKVAAVTPAGADQPRLGLYLAPLTSEVREAHGIDDQAMGVLVAQVEPGSPAQRAGVRPGSLISMVGQQRVAAPEEVIASVHKAFTDDLESVLLLLERDGERRFVAIPFRA